MTAVRRLLVGGLGGFHDGLVAAVLRAQGRDAVPLGSVDRAALERGRAALPRGQCAPLLYTTGALLEAVGAASNRPLAYMGLSSCGPCRYAVFEDGWRRAVTEAHPDADVGFLRLMQSPLDMTERFGSRAVVQLIEAVVVADAVAEQVRRLAPSVTDAAALDAAAGAAVQAIGAELASGADPLVALARHADWHRPIARCAPGPLARVALVGEPWSLHADGDGQLHLPRLLAAAGVEIEVPPVALWIAYVLWQHRNVRWGAERPDASAKRAAAALERFLAEAIEEAGAIAGLGGFVLPDVEALAELAAPHLPPTLLGGYGHLEVGLAARAKRERRAHAVISVKSFGCIPSSGTSDGILPTVLGDLPFLALEVCGDGEAARESRLMMRVAAARERAAADLADACARAGVVEEEISAPDPLAGWSGARRYACSLACAVAEGAAA